MMGRVSVVTVVTELRAGRTEVWSPARAVVFLFPENFEVRHPRCFEPKLQNGKVQSKQNCMSIY